MLISRMQVDHAGENPPVPFQREIIAP